MGPRRSRSIIPNTSRSTGRKRKIEEAEFENGHSSSPNGDDKRLKTPSGTKRVTRQSTTAKKTSSTPSKTPRASSTKSKTSQSTSKKLSTNTKKKSSSSTRKSAKKGPQEEGEDEDIWMLSAESNNDEPDEDDWNPSGSGDDDDDGHASTFSDGSASDDDEEEKYTPTKKSPKKTVVKKSRTAASATKSSIKKGRGTGRSKSSINFSLGSESTPTKVVREKPSEDIENSIPEFCRPENVRDSEGKKPDHPEYDPTTVAVPAAFLKQQTPVMKQYWAFKSKNFDKLVIFKIAGWFELYYEDAIKAKDILGLNWGPKKVLHVGFRFGFDKYLKLLAQAGHTVVVIEQMESSWEMAQRNKMVAKGVDKQKTVRRGIEMVVSPGTVIDTDTTYHAKWMLSLAEGPGNLFGLTLTDITRTVFYCGYFCDNSHLNKFRTLISQIRPCEVVYATGHVSQEAIKMLKNMPNRPKITALKEGEFSSHDVSVTYLKDYYGDKLKDWPELLKEYGEVDAPEEVHESDKYEDRSAEVFISSDRMKSYAFRTFALKVKYLDTLLIAERITSSSSVNSYENLSRETHKMLLDAQALEHLEIFEALSESCTLAEEGSLFEYLRCTATKFGTRMLKDWVAAPLRDPEEIEQRLEAVSNLIEYSQEREMLQKLLLKFPDLERSMSNIYLAAAKNKENRTYWEVIAEKKIKNFYEVITTLRSIPDILSLFDGCKALFTSVRLQKLLTFETEEVADGQKGILPDFLTVLDKYDQLIRWEGDDNPVAIPLPGVNKKFDDEEEKIEDIKRDLEVYLKGIRERFSDDKRIQYAHIKERYELEIPAELVKGKKKPEEFELTSFKAGFQRFHTPQIKKFVNRLTGHEYSQYNALMPFLGDILQDFHNQRTTWAKVISCLAELDCLGSLSTVSLNTKKYGRMCRPEIISDSSEPFMLEVTEMRHPTIALSVPNFVHNDIKICCQDEGENHEGNDENDEEKNVLLITGPNMGGKSTILRQAAVAVIMAQIGCYVPAKYCRIAPADRIFTRIGASDRILEGKSTFYVEMEETKEVLSGATDKSLVIMDELGRGTSTFDGLSIAYSVLDFIAKEIRCRTLFTTHYHLLLDEFRDAKNIETYHMGAEIDEKKETVKFTYKFSPGECPKSHGINVAGLAGISSDVLETAKVASKSFEHYMLANSYRRMNRKSTKLKKLLGNAKLTDCLLSSIKSLVSYDQHS